MSVTYQSVGGVDQGSSSCAPTQPAVVTAGDLLVLAVAWGNSADAVPATPTGFTAPSNNTYIGGAGSYGVDAGHRGITIFYREADGTEDGATVTVNNGGTGSTRVITAQIARLTKTAANWFVTVVGNSDDTSDTSFSIAAASDPGAVNGDMALFAGAWIPDSVAMSSPDIVWTGTGSGATQIQSIANTNGNDLRFLLYRRALTGTSSAAPSFTASPASAVSGAGAIILIHDGAAATTGSGTATLPSLTGSGTGSVIDSGSGAAALPSATASGSGTVTTTGSGAGTLPAATANGTGSVDTGATSGAGAATLPAASASGSGTLTTDGTGSTTLPAVTAASSGTVTTTGEGTAALPAASASGDGIAFVPGVGAAVLPALIAEGSDVVPRDVTVNSITEHVRGVVITDRQRAVTVNVRPRSFVATDRQRAVTITEHPRTVVITDRS